MTKIVPAIGIFLALYFSTAGAQGLFRLADLNQTKDEMELQLKTQQEMNNVLVEEISALRYNRMYLENIARKDFGLVHPGETVYQFVGEKNEQNGSVQK